MGCSSGLLRPQGDLDPNGMALKFVLSGAPATVANLWDVTDGDIDRYTCSLLKVGQAARAIQGGCCCSMRLPRLPQMLLRLCWVRRFRRVVKSCAVLQQSYGRCAPWPTSTGPRLWCMAGQCALKRSECCRPAAS